MIVSYPRIAVRCRGLSTVHVLDTLFLSNCAILDRGIYIYLVIMKRSGVVITTVENNKFFDNFHMVSVFLS